VVDRVHFLTYEGYKGEIEKHPGGFNPVHGSVEFGFRIKRAILLVRLSDFSFIFKVKLGGGNEHRSFGRFKPGICIKMTTIVIEESFEIVITKDEGSENKIDIKYS
jgi:hypothetical protein